MGGGGGGGRVGGGERGGGEGGKGARRGSKVADAVLPLTFIELDHLPSYLLKKINLNVMFLFYYIFKVINSLQIKQCLITEKSLSCITRQHQKRTTNKDLTKENIKPRGVIIQMTFVTFQGPELNSQFFT